MNSLLGVPQKKPMKPEGENEDLMRIQEAGADKDSNDPISIINGLYKLLIARQRLPNFENKMARLFSKGKKRLHDDLDIVNQARNT